MSDETTAPETASESQLKDAPAWLRDIDRFLAVMPQFLLSGNINDQYLIGIGGIVQPLSLADALCVMLDANGFEALLRYNPFTGFTVHDATDESLHAAWLAAKPPEVQSHEIYKEQQGSASSRERVEAEGYEDRATRERRITRTFWQDGSFETSVAQLPDILRNVLTCRTARVAVLIDQASRLVLSGRGMTESETALFGSMWKLADEAVPMQAKRGDRHIFSPIFWAAENLTDLPDWFVAGNEKLRVQSIQKPDFAMRQRYARGQYRQFSNYEKVSDEQRDELLKVFASSTEGMTLSEMKSIVGMARDLNKDFSKLQDAVTAFKLGVTEESPWTSSDFRQRIATAQTTIAAKVAGQNRAIAKTIDILSRSAMGLSGAHVSEGNSAKPQGVLFFAGPTGTGKTQLAKEITKLLFNNQDAYIRFDMSEFAAEHSDSRLIGAPPGYVGYDAGGELTRAIRERPVSVVLFDEIEKAHPRILDKFLQILDDGRLTDNRGNTVYFSEALIIFTSNLGIYKAEMKELGRVERTMNVRPGEPYHIIETRVREAIEDHFKYKLERPEILNRIGDNIVVFNFISEPAAEKIFNGMIANLLSNASKKHRIKLEVSDEAKDKLRPMVITEKARANGGRGIANQIESCFINPLSRSLFQADFNEGDKVVVVDVVEKDLGTEFDDDSEGGPLHEVKLEITQ